MKTSIVETSTLSAGYGATPGDVYYSSPFGAYTSASGALGKSQLYRTYTTLYEEVKIVGVKVSIAVVTPVGDTTTPSLQIYTSWDRKHATVDDAPTATDIINASSYNVATALNNNVAKITRSCYASDLMEKAVWIDATTNAQYANLAWIAGGSNCPCFVPSLAFTCLSPSLGAAHPITISVSYTYYMAFRNPKFGGGSNAKATVEDLGARTIGGKGSSPDGPGDVDMEDEDVIQIFSEGTSLAGDVDAPGDVDPPRHESVTSTASLSREAQRAGIPSATVAAQSNRLARDRLVRGGKNV